MQDPTPDPSSTAQPAWARVGADTGDGGTVLEISEAFAELYELQDEDVTGRPLGEVLAGAQGALPWPQRFATARSGTAWRDVEQHLAASGARRWVHAELASEGSCLVLRVRRAPALEVVRRRHDLANLLVDAMAAGEVGVWYDDGATNQLEWSAQARRIYRYDPAEPITHEAFFSVVHPDDRQRLGAEIQEVLATGNRTFRFAFRVGDGENARHVESFGKIVLGDDGQLLLGIGGVRERPELDELRRLRARVDTLERQLEQAQRVDTVGRLAAGIAHDFNNLLTGVAGFAELLSLGELDGEQRAHVSEILACVERGSGLTRQLLSHARPQPPAKTILDPQTVIADTCRLLRRAVPENIEIRELPGEGTTTHVCADASQLQQVLSNLLLNASHAMPEGGVVQVGLAVATLDRPTARLPPGDYVRIEVRDAGAGIAPEIRDRIFDPFFTTRAEGRGTGLGLSVARDIARRHGGELELDSDATGTCATLWLPLTAPAEDLPEEGPAAQRPALLGRGRRLLLVEDESMVRAITAALLRERVFQVLEAPDGSAARVLAEALEAPVDLLITDVIMPRVTGPQLVAQLRARWPALKVLYLSGYPANQVRGPLAQAGDEIPVLAKPHTREQLLEAIHSALGD